MKYRTLIFAILCLFSLKLNSQNTAVHFDKPYYFAGEYIFYSFCNHTLDSVEISAKVKLRNIDRDLGFYFLKIEHRCGQGYFKIPHDASSGIYTFDIEIFEAEDIHPVLLFRTGISIYGPEISGTFSDSRIIQFEDSDQEDVAHPGSENILVEESMSVKIDLSNVEDISRISVAVRDHDLFAHHQNSFGIFECTVDSMEFSSGIPFRGVRKIVSKGTMENRLLFALNPRTLLFDGTTVDDESGVFTMSVSPFYGENRITFLDYLDNKISIEELEEEEQDLLASQISVDQRILEHQKLHQEAKQIDLLFKKVAVNLQWDTSKIMTGLPKPDYDVDVQDYSIRGTPVDLFREILTALKFRSAGKNKYVAKTLYERNGITKFFSRSPLFVINDYSTRDGNLIANFPLQEIKGMKIYGTYDLLQKMSSIALGGIVLVDLMDPNYTLPPEFRKSSLVLQGLQKPLSYPIAFSGGGDRPEIGSLIYWNPSLDLRHDAPSFQFTPGDVATSYLIECLIFKKKGGIDVWRKIIEVPGK